jgi:hypothetical protein
MDVRFEGFSVKSMKITVISYFQAILSGRSAVGIATGYALDD